MRQYGGVSSPCNQKIMTKMMIGPFLENVYYYINNDKITFFNMNFISISSVSHSHLFLYQDPHQLSTLSKTCIHSIPLHHHMGILFSKLQMIINNSHSQRAVFKWQWATESACNIYHENTIWSVFQSDIGRLKWASKSKMLC